MNCKPGDLAIVVKPNSANTGRIVEVMKWGESNQGDSGWWCCAERPLIDIYKKPANVVVFANRDLRPIRPTDGEDETLQWAGKPQEVTA